MQPVVFVPRALPADIAGDLRRRLERSHDRSPFSSQDPRGTVRRVARILTGLGLPATVYRGGLDLSGAEVDHVWLEVDGRVVDAAFPLYADRFVTVLRRYVAGDIDGEDLEAAATGTSVDQRVVGLFPASMRYAGLPVWTSRRGA